jgi:hypothetical protein
MRFAVVLASLIATVSVASADPLAAEARSSSEAPADVYVAGGVMLGSAGGHDAGGFSVDFGRRIWSTLWFHAGGTFAGTSDGLFGGTGTYTEAHGGLEVSSCHPGDRVCLFAGADVGYEESKFSDADWFGGDTMTTENAGVIGLARFGLDVGGKHVRWRPGFQAAFGSGQSAAITQSLAVRF